VAEATGVAGTGSVGDVTVSSDANALVSGVSATGETSNVNVWGAITPSQTPNWVSLTPSQTPSWSSITPSQTPSWSAITPSQTPNWSSLTPSQTPNWQETKRKAA